MERDLNDFDPKYIFEKEEFFQMVKKIMSLNFFNRIKQFMIRVFWNNLYLGDKSNKQTNVVQKCFSCGNHTENRVEVMLNCARTNSILHFLIRVLRKSGGLQYGCKIDMFLSKNYPINSIENISLMFTWKHIYNSKYYNETLLCIPFAYAYRGLITFITHMSCLLYTSPSPRD